MSHNLQMTKTKQIRVSVNLHSELKSIASSRKITLAKLAEEVFIQYYKSTNEPLMYKPVKRRKTAYFINKQKKAEERLINQQSWKKLSSTHESHPKNKKKLGIL